MQYSDHAHYQMFQYPVGQSTMRQSTWGFEMMLWPLQTQHTETEALQRSLTVFEILGNLHCHSDHVENPQMEGHFARLLHAEVLKCGKAGEGSILNDWDKA